MDHEVFVPFPAEAVRRALADPVRVARSVPGLQREAGAEAEAEMEAGAVTGRLRLRVGGSTITYRGTLRLTASADGFVAEAEATEARGAGTVKLGIGIGVEPAEGGTLLRFSGTVQTDGGRLGEFGPEVVEAAGHRLLDRFVSGLTQDIPQDTPQDVPQDIPQDDEDLLPEGVTVPESAAELDPLDDPLDALDTLDPLDLEAVEAATAEPPAEAAHARRTMIGRSAEEVDHAPPRGRYAPVPPPETASATATLRWAAPAAAVLIAGAVIVGRALRKRRP